MEQYQDLIDQNKSNIKEVTLKYLSYWKWYILSVIVCGFLAMVYLRYQTPVYQVNASILIKDDRKGGTISDELSAFEDLGILKNNKNIDNEIEILKSRSLMTLTVKELKLNVQYFSYGRPIEHERYFDTPFIASYTHTDSTLQTIGNWVIIPENSTDFVFLDGKSKSVIGHYKFNDSIPIAFGKMVITKTRYFQKTLLKKEFRIIIDPVDLVVDRYCSVITVTPVNKNASTIAISLRDSKPKKAAAIVDNLIKQHNLDAIEDKNQVSQNTYDFISERIKFIAQELSDVESSLEDYKTKNKLIDITNDGNVFLLNGTESEKILIDANTQSQIAEYVVNYMQKHNGVDQLIPADLGIADAPVSKQIEEFNTLVLERIRLIKYSSAKNPVIINLENQIAGLRNAITESLINYQNSLKIKVGQLAKNDDRINSKISKVPKHEREYRYIQRQQQIKEALYLYLLQKREETNIALAVTVANAKVIDYAYSNGKIVAPKKQVIYLSFFVLGLIIPTLMIYLFGVLDTKVHRKSDIDFIKAPFIGDIPVSDSKKKVVVFKNDNSSVAEAFRLLRTNLDFMLGKNSGSGHAIFVTSTLGKEGKTFIALNLAASIAQSGKKVILLGMDFRAPKILKYLSMQNKEGITNYILDTELNLENLIFNSDQIEGLDILPSGSIPPNPAELLMNQRVGELFEKLRSKYDYIIVDTAPVGMVTDTLIISKYASAFLFVVRANVLEKRLLSIAENLYKERRLPNMSVLLNGTDIKKGYGYGYGYGYGNETEKKSWLKKIFSKTED